MGYTCVPFNEEGESYGSNFKRWRHLHWHIRLQQQQAELLMMSQRIQAGAGFL
ncbi:hypothetical protein KNP414_01977 [Paenibacillus mucilaginosus KNP414]|uniref:Uncharacterized protein n=1 Tax=Paenibacillus mucilaginosus (strain KNP414) TaxID=1036673 RepID=F8FRI1_PAEMK|nr:hypothetical protein KNP414_01977 [Paenibacillus mucilaginosus KNP414]